MENPRTMTTLFLLEHEYNGIFDVMLSLDGVMDRIYYVTFVTRIGGMCTGVFSEYDQVVFCWSRVCLYVYTYASQ